MIGIRVLLFVKYSSLRIWGEGGMERVLEGRMGCLLGLLVLGTVLETGGSDG